MLPNSDIGFLAVIIIVVLLLAFILARVWARLKRLRNQNKRLVHELAEMERAYVNAPLGLAMIDCNLRFIKINKLLADINGFSIEEHIGKTIYEMVPDIASQAEGPFLQVIKTGKPVMGLVFEGVTIHAPDVRRVWRENVYPILGEDGSVIGINVAAEEITEEKRLNDALQASELRERQRATELEAVMNATPAAIFISRDIDCTHVAGNDEAKRMLRMDTEDNLSANPPPGEKGIGQFVDYATGKALAAKELPMQLAAATGREMRSMELTYRYADGELIHVLTNAAPLLNQEGKVVGAIGAFIDLTRQKQAEHALLRESLRKDEFIATLAHELRNPLAAIQTGLELFKFSPDSSSSFVANTRDVMERQLAHLVRLIDDLLDVSRISSGKLELKREKTSVQSIVAAALETSRPTIEAAGHSLEVDLPVMPLYVEADLVRIEQVINNLLNNAAKYTPEGGHIRIAVKEEGGNAKIRIIDNGIGIDKDMLPKLFTLFSQAENARNRRQGGIGIGLSLARRLVEMHGGALSVESAGPGCGSTFTILVPLYTGKDADNSGRNLAAGEEVMSEHRRILVVDDNKDAATTLSTLFQMAGHIVHICYAGRDVLDAARQFFPDIIFLDIGLPDLDGLEVCRQLRKENEFGKTTIVALTGWGGEKDRSESRQAGFDCHLTKPATMEAIKSALPYLKMPD